MPSPAKTTSVVDRQALVQAILDLDGDGPALIPDPAVASALARLVKPYVDRLASPLPQEDDPEDRDYEDESALEMLAEPGETAAPAAPDGSGPLRSRSAALVPAGPTPELATLGPEERARWIFLERYVSLERLQQVLGYPFAPADLDRYRDDLGRMLDDLLMLPPTAVAWSHNDVPALQQSLASMVLLLRHPFVADTQGDPVPCNLRNLRERFPAYFYRRYRAPNWYEDLPFCSAPLAGSRWVACDVTYLNCTLRRADRKLAAYARQWFLSPENVLQKSVVEDVYDRILCGEAVGEDLFETNCSSCTSTGYDPVDGGPPRIAFTVQKNRKVAVHGKAGVPHWKASRRLWPGVFPVIVFP